MNDKEKFFCCSGKEKKKEGKKFEVKRADLSINPLTY